MGNICCFAGHGKLTYTDEIFYRLKAAIEKVIREDYVTEFWVDNAAMLLCFVSHSWGGAAETLGHAEKRGIKIINLVQ